MGGTQSLSRRNDSYPPMSPRLIRNTNTRRGTVSSGKSPGRQPGLNAARSHRQFDESGRLLRRSQPKLGVPFLCRPCSPLFCTPCSSLSCVNQVEGAGTAPTLKLQRVMRRISDWYPGTHFVTVIDPNGRVRAIVNDDESDQSRLLAALPSLLKSSLRFGSSAGQVSSQAVHVRGTQNLLTLLAFGPDNNYTLAFCSRMSPRELADFDVSTADSRVQPLLGQIYQQVKSLNMIEQAEQVGKSKKSSNASRKTKAGRNIVEKQSDATTNQTSMLEPSRRSAISVPVISDMSMSSRESTDVANTKRRRRDFVKSLDLRSPSLSEHVKGTNRQSPAIAVTTATTRTQSSPADENEEQAQLTTYAAISNVSGASVPLSTITEGDCNTPEIEVE